MEIRVCGKGHYYSPDLYPECPECAFENKVEVTFDDASSHEPTTARIAQCSAGHYYSAILKRCPVCSRNPLPPMAGKEATCANGHEYDRGFSLNCPICGAPQKTYPKKNPRKEFADIKPDNNTLLFTAFGGLSYWLRRSGGQMRLTARSMIGRSGMVLENTVPVSMDDTMRAARKILDALRGAEDFLQEPDCDTGDSRFLFNTRQLNCDHRWQEKPSLSCTTSTFYMRQVQEILGELYAKVSPSHGFTPEEGWKLRARLDYCNIDLKLYRTDVSYELVLEEIIYYQFTNALTLCNRVKVPLSIGAEILSWLGDCGVMEALIGKSKRPGDGICRDPAMATVFYLDNGDLTFDYRDWDKMNQGMESEVLNKAQNKLLEWFEEIPMYCNPI